MIRSDCIVFFSFFKAQPSFIFQHDTIKKCRGCSGNTAERLRANRGNFIISDSSRCKMKDLKEALFKLVRWSVGILENAEMQTSRNFLFLADRHVK